MPLVPLGAERGRALALLIYNYLRDPSFASEWENFRSTHEDAILAIFDGPQAVLSRYSEATALAVLTERSRRRLTGKISRTKLPPGLSLSDFEALIEAVEAAMSRADELMVNLGSSRGLWAFLVKWGLDYPMVDEMLVQLAGYQIKGPTLPQRNKLAGEWNPKEDLSPLAETLLPDLIPSFVPEPIHWDQASRPRSEHEAAMRAQLDQWEDYLRSMGFKEPYKTLEMHMQWQAGHPGVRTSDYLWGRKSCVCAPVPKGSALFDAQVGRAQAFRITPSTAMGLPILTK